MRAVHSFETALTDHSVMHCHTAEERSAPTTLPWVTHYANTFHVCFWCSLPNLRLDIGQKVNPTPQPHHLSHARKRAHTHSAKEVKSIKSYNQPEVIRAAGWVIAAYILLGGYLCPYDTREFINDWLYVTHSEICIFSQSPTDGANTQTASTSIHIYPKQASRWILKQPFH